MFNIGFSEIGIVIIVIIIVFKPKDYPLLIKRIKGYYKKLINTKNSIKEEFKDDWDI